MGNEGRTVADRNRRPAEIHCYWGGLARLLEMGDCADSRGSLVELDFPAMPFQPRRSFIVHGVPGDVVRGGHAHRCGQQLLMCLAGTIIVEMRLDGEVQRVELSTRTQALLMKAGVWAQQSYSGSDAVLLVMASDPYDADSYIIESP